MEKGFTLLEVLVAFAIAATSLLVLSSAYNSMVNTSRHAQQKQQALLLAESEIARISTQLLVTEGDYEATRGEYEITTQVRRWQDPESDIASDRLYQLQTTVRWQHNGQRQLQLHSVHLSEL
jgi:general secretion pathway protein I